jgi:prolyl 4-hydroxylase
MIPILVLVLTLLALLFIFTRPTPNYTRPVIFRKFITPDEQDYILAKSENLFKESTVVGSDGNSIMMDVRKSETAWIPKDDPIIKKIYERALAKTNLKFENAEDMQVVRYQPGGFYKAHQDAFCDETSIKMLDSRGQRKGTFIMYLNEDYEGGGTEFPTLGKVYKGSERDALYFHTLDKNNKCCEDAKHGGLEVTKGQKIICNMWFH